MYVLANFAAALGRLISLLIAVYTWVIIARVFISWVNASPYNPVVRTIYSLTEPVLRRIRRIVPAIPAGGGYLDLSPLVLLLLLQFLDYFLVKTLSDTAYHLRGM